jgi:hypothetical protein
MEKTAPSLVFGLLASADALASNTNSFSARAVGEQPGKPTLTSEAHTNSLLNLNDSLIQMGWNAMTVFVLPGGRNARTCSASNENAVTGRYRDKQCM